MRILIVEDNPSDRELLRYLLEEHFHKEAKFREASDLKTAKAYLKRGNIDCIILDLSLPDSFGKDTFQELYDVYPHIPIVVMTHNKDRDLAVEMIKDGATDYILKDFTNKDEIFRRIIYAIEKSKNTVRMPKDDVDSIKKMDEVQAELRMAHQSGEHRLITDSNMHATSALVELSKKNFVLLQDIAMKQAQHSVQLPNVIKSVDELNEHILHGKNGRKSMVSQLEILTDKAEEFEVNYKKHDEEINKLKSETEKKKKSFELKTLKLDSFTKVFIAIITALGVLAGSYFTYKAATDKSDKPQTEIRKKK